PAHPAEGSSLSSSLSSSSSSPLRSQRIQRNATHLPFGLLLILPFCNHIFLIVVQQQQQLCILNNQKVTRKLPYRDC
ncbi:hypothetical protein TYRP_022477, partial [Tyrophagus putrescentiae]